jgi:uncharacterized membrane protein YdfJ with MMPL/SSD domain
MLSSIARVATRRPRRVALASLVVFVVVAVFGGPAAGLLNVSNQFDDPSSGVAQQRALFERASGAEPSPGVLVLVDAPPGSRAVRTLEREGAGAAGVAGLAAPVGSRDGRKTLIAVTLRAGAAVKAVEAGIRRIAPAGTLVGGSDVAGEQTGGQASSDLGVAELLAFPVLALISLLVFRGIAALLPVAVGGVSVLGTFALLRAINAVHPLSNFALNLVIGVGLGLAVDYSLLLVWRFREELSRGASVPDAVSTMLQTAGRAVAYSGLAVAGAMMVLTLFPQPFLISMGIGGAVVALVAAAASLLILPALLTLLATRVGKVQPEPDGSGGWYRTARAVMRRPAAVALVTTALLGIVAAPTLGVRWSGIDQKVLPTSQSARVVADAVSTEFSHLSLNPIAIAAKAPASAASSVAAYARRVLQVPGLRATAVPRYVGAGTWELQFAAGGDPISAGAQRTVAAVDALHAPFRAYVGGPAAALHDQQASISSVVPFALAVLVLLTLGILWLMTGSVVLPIKALLMNGLTTAVATGVLMLVFQDGRLTGLLGDTSQGGLEQTNFLVMVAVVFALSTDYGVLLLNRIKEARDAGHDNREAVALGLQRSGRILSAAATLMAVALGAFVTSQLVFLKEIGLGSVVAVLVDAFIVRAALVPALMALLGDWNWWSPKPLRALHRVVGLSEGPPAPTISEAGIPQSA